MKSYKPKHKDRTLGAEEDDSCVDEIKPKRKDQGLRGGFGKQKPTSYTSGQFGEPKRCSYCGRGQHPPEQCPANGAICHRCHKRGHFSLVCRSKIIQEVSYQNQEAKVYLDAVLEKSGSGWFTELQWGRHEVQFKLDTGAEVSVISEKTYRNVGQPALHAPDKMLFGASHCPLQVLGYCKAKLWYKNSRTSVQTVYVVKGLSSNLLGLPAITALNLAARVEAIDDLRARILQTFPAVFQGHTHITHLARGHSLQHTHAQRGPTHTHTCAHT